MRDFARLAYVLERFPCRAAWLTQSPLKKNGERSSLQVGEDGAHEGGETGLALALEALGGEDGGEAR